MEPSAGSAPDDRSDIGICGGDAEDSRWVGSGIVGHEARERSLMKAATFLLKHSIAAATVILGSLGMVALVYVALLLWALLTSGGLGGPLAFPGMVLFVFVAVAASVVIILFPVTAVAGALRMKGGVNRFLEIPIATTLLIAYVAAGLAAIAFVRDWSVAGTIRGGSVFVVIQLLLLGAYWWALQATHAVASFVSAAWHRVTRSRPA